MKAGVSLAWLFLLLHCSCCWASSGEPHGTADSASSSRVVESVVVEVAPTAVEVPADELDVARTAEPMTTIDCTTAVLAASIPPLAPSGTSSSPNPDAQTVATTADAPHVSQEPVQHHATTTDSTPPLSPTAGSSTSSSATAAHETPDAAAPNPGAPASTTVTTAAAPTASSDAQSSAPNPDPDSVQPSPPPFATDTPPVVSSATSSVTAPPDPNPSASKSTSTEDKATVSSSHSTTSTTTTATAIATTAAASTTEEASKVPPLAAQTTVVSDDTVEAPEFLSFNEWKDKYVVVAADASAAAARRFKKTAQRARQDAHGGQASFDGDGADFGSLFASEEASGTGDDRAKDQGPGASNGAARTKADGAGSHKPRQAARGSDGKNDNALNVPLIQPLPNVGTGEPSDPLLLLKDRSNYAAFECAAMVHRSSRQSKGASSILVEKKDRYMLTPCSADPKFVEVELCDEIQIDAIVLANFELFSSMFKYFEMTCSVDYPGRPETWHNLGTFRARNARGIQVFRPNPVPNFCRYVRINFLTHYGSEYYCPVSLLRVYGYTQLDAHRESERKKAELEAALASALEEGDAEEDEEEDTVPSPSVSKLPTSHEASASAAPVVESPTKQVENATISDRDTVSTKPSTSTAPPTSTSVDSPTHAPSITASAAANGSGQSLNGTEPTSTVDSAVIPSSTPSRGDEPTSPHASGDTTVLASVSLDGTIIQTPTSPTGTVTSVETQPSTGTPVSINPSPSVPSGSSHAPASSATEPIHPSPSEASAASSTSEASATTTTSSESVNTTVPPNLPPLAAEATASAPRPPASESPLVTVRHVPRNETIRPMPPLPQITSPQPQPGESIYTTIMKRLTILEQNQTIAMHYIEAQSTMLREAFLRVERRLKDVEGMHQRQEQSFRLILSELDKQRLDIENERLSLTAQVAVLAQEVRLEKRLSIAELFGLLALVIFVVATRGSPTSPLMHLTSSQVLRRAAAQAEARKVELVRREGADLHRRSDDALEKMAPGLERERERTRKASATRNAIAGLGRAPSGKRTPISIKTAPRRNYGTTSASRTPVLRANRAWSPPVRHSSAPPDEIFPDFVTNGDGPTTTRSLQRRGSRKSNGGYGNVGLSEARGLGVFPNGFEPGQSARASSPLQHSTVRHRGSVDLSDGMLSDDQFSTTTSASEPMHQPGGLYSAHATDEADDERGSRYSDDEGEETLLSPLPITSRPMSSIPSSPSLANASTTSRSSPPRKVAPPASPRRHSSPLIPFPLVDDDPDRLAPTSRLPSPPPEPVSPAVPPTSSPNVAPTESTSPPMEDLS